MRFLTSLILYPTLPYTGHLKKCIHWCRSLEFTAPICFITHLKGRSIANSIFNMTKDLCNTNVKIYLDENLLYSFVRRRGHIECPARSPYLTVVDFPYEIIIKINSMTSRRLKNQVRKDAAQRFIKCRRCQKSVDNSLRNVYIRK